MNLLYRLTHEYEVEENDEIYSIITEIAIYSSFEKARRGLEKFRSQPLFLKYPDGFEISEIEVDKCYWSEGFISYK